MHRYKGEIRLAGAILDQYRHVCAFFHSPDEEYRVLLPFIKDGIDQGEKAFHIIDPTLRPEHVRRLEEATINVAAIEQSGQLEVRRISITMPAPNLARLYVHITASSYFGKI